MDFSQKTFVLQDLLIFLLVSVLLFLVVFIHPIMFFNDEWVTANQLHQLSEGSQIQYNEGKYGVHRNGTVDIYFEVRHNSLPYTSYLPLASIPVLWILTAIGDHITYLIIVIWISLALLLTLLVSESVLLPKIFSHRIIRVLMLSGIILFFLSNLVTYNPLSISGATDSSEVLAVVLYHMILYSLFTAILLLINWALFSTPTRAVFGTITSLCCSSALFWTTTVKDHMDVMFFGAVLIYCIILHIKTRDPWFCLCTFILSGLTLWIRPEYGAFIIGILVVIYWPLMIITRKEMSGKQTIILLMSPVAALPGAFLLFLNNYLVMGDPFKFPWQLAFTNAAVSNEILPFQVTSGAGPDLLHNGIIHTILSLFLHRITPGGDVISGLFSAFLFPESLKIPVFGLIPIILLSVFLLPLLLIHVKKSLSSEEIQETIILLSLAIGTVLAYLSSITGLGTSIGIYPDVRYLSPLYLPLTLVGLIILMKYEFPDHILLHIIRNISLAVVTGVGFMVCVTTWFYPAYIYSDFFLWINIIISSLVFTTLGITIIAFILSDFGIVSDRVRYLPLAVLIALPLIWQISELILINFSGTLFDHYPPLLPAVRAFVEYLSGSTAG